MPPWKSMTRFLKKINPVCWSIPSGLFMNMPSDQWRWGLTDNHYNDVIMSAMASQITSVSIVYLTVSSGADLRKHQFRVTGLCLGNSPVTGKFPAQRASNAENVSIWPCHHEVDFGSVNGLMPSGSQSITWTNSDPNLYRHMTSLGHNAFNICVLLLILISVWRYLYLLINDSMASITWRTIAEIRDDYV